MLATPRDVSGTTVPEGTWHAEQRHLAPQTLVLCVTWCPEDPSRVGEVLIVPPGSGDRAYVFGRGDDEPSFRKASQRLFLCRDRPGRIVRSSPLALHHVSREQLAITADRVESLRVVNLGRLPIEHNGRAVEKQITMVPNDVLQLGRQIMLLCVRRPAWIAQSPSSLEGEAAFGSADVHGIVGESPVIWELRRQIAFVAKKPDRVLVIGATGTGKELVAQAIHASSPRARLPLVAQNAATFPESLIDAELFGNAKNYPNPGMPERAGLIGRADGSTLFLDEIGELSPPLQTHLLRLLDAGEYRRLGEETLRRASLQVIAATNRPEGLKADVAARFTTHITTPELNERREDIPLLARIIMRRLLSSEAEPRSRSNTTPSHLDSRLSPSLVRRLVQHPYTAHFRELQAILVRCVQRASDHGTIEWIEDEHPRAVQPPALAHITPSPMPSTVDPRQLRSEDVQSCLERHQGKLEPAWRELGLSSRHALRRLIEKRRLNIRRP
jgi:two-component system nitrogen regulation response regulator GlnG/two-component system response regulator HydG